MANTVESLARCSGMASRSVTCGPSAAGAQASKLLATTVAQQAPVLSCIDGFMAAAGGAFACLLLVALMRAPPSSPSWRRLSRAIAPLRTPGVLRDNAPIPDRPEH